VDLDEIADELYGVAPEQFVERRGQLAAQARQAGDRRLAAAAAKLARPTTSAWLVNTLARTDPARLAELADIGAGLRHAQTHLDADELRRLTARRQTVIAALTRYARRLAADRGHPVGEAIGREVEATLGAALADPAAAEAVRSGRLTRALRHVGLGPVEIADAVAAPAGAPRPRPGPPAAAPAGPLPASRTASPDGPEEARRRQREADERRRREALEAARLALAAADADTAQARHRLDEDATAASAARDRSVDLRRRADALAADLDRARREAATAATEAVAAERRRAEAARAAERAERRRARAQEELDRLVREPGSADAD
jgi:hypothetical protein